MTGLQLSPDLQVTITNTHANLGQNVIATTEDKLELAARDYDARVKLRSSLSLPASISVTSLVAVTTADFKSFLGIPATSIQAIYWVALIVGVIWFVVLLFKVKREAGPKSLVEMIKQRI